MIVYENTKGHPGSHNYEPFGMAYETDDFFVHHYCTKGPILWFGERVYQRKNGLLRDWVVDVFGAVNIQESNLPPGTTKSQVWRPGVGFNKTQEFLGNSISDFGKCARALLILLQKLSDIFDFIEPADDGLSAYGHKTRELLILTCTEVENYWVHYLKLAGVTKDRYSTNDYVTLKSPLHLAEYKVIRDRLNLAECFPFANWNSTQPTQSLEWYDAYNQVKHDRNENFPKATVKNCINSVAACSVLFSARFGPGSLSGNLSKLSTQFNEMFSVELHNPDIRSFYIPTWEIEDRGDDRLSCPLDFNPEVTMNSVPFTI